MARILTLVTALLALAAANCLAQDAMLEELYGRGVHAYFAGNIRAAFDSLNASIQSGSRDPRAFYYRGIVLNRLGRPDEAAADFRKGTELEMLGGEPYPVGKSLERIQGPERIMLETHRRAATSRAAPRARYNARADSRSCSAAPFAQSVRSDSRSAAFAAAACRSAADAGPCCSSPRSNRAAC